MIEYLSLTIFFCFEIFVMSRTSQLRRKSKLCMTLLFLQFWIFYGFRHYTVLPDTETYYQIYTHLSTKLRFGDFDSSDRFGIAYQSIEYLFRNNLDLSFVWFLSFVTFFILWGSFRFFYKYSPITWIPLFLFVISLDIFSNLIAIRQGIALSIGLMSFPLLVKKRYIVYTIMIIIAYMFHSSALGYILLVPVFMEGISYKTKIWIVLGGGLSIFIAYSFIFDIIESVSGHPSSYVMSSKSKDGLNLIGLFSSLRTFGIIMVILYLRRMCIKRQKLISPFDEALFIIALLNLAISIFGIRFWIMGRFRLYFDPFLFIFIPILYNRVKNYSKARIALNILFLYIIFCSLFLAYVRPEWIGLFPYKFYGSL